VGDFVAIDPQPEVTDTGYIVARHLDNKAGVAALLTVAKAVQEHRMTLPVDVHLLFTIFEEVGSGASAVLHQDMAEMVSVENATPAPGQNSSEHDVTIAMMDSHGPFVYHLNQQLLHLAREHGIDHGRDVFRHYRCDAASALEAGNDIRTALLCFGVDGSHGYERTHLRSLELLTRLLTLYLQSEPAIPRDRMELGPSRASPSSTAKPHQFREKTRGQTASISRGSALTLGLRSQPLQAASFPCKGGAL
jgi:putative aminopeptidase FrvX